MKKIILLVLLIPLGVVAQRKIGVSGFYMFSQPETYGISLEESFRDFPIESFIVNIGKSHMYYDIGNQSIKGKGYGFEVGYRTYRCRSRGGYFENLFSFARVNFDGNYFEKNDIPKIHPQVFKGSYIYWTLINPSFGYRFKAKPIFVDVFGGFTWKWELKGRGDVDNKQFDNFVFKAGVKIGFIFKANNNSNKNQ